jgi:uncharacterized protein
MTEVGVMDLETIPRDEALRLMATVPVGRIVFTVRALPAVLPVNFVLDGGDVVVRTGPGSKLSAALRNAVVAFQVDRISEQTQSGWSVTITGRAEEIRDRTRIARLDGILRSWAGGDRDHFIRIPTELVSGRRLPPAPVETDATEPIKSTKSAAVRFRG